MMLSQIMSAMMFFFITVTIHKLLEKLWWRPKRIGEHFAKQGIQGPAYKFFIGNAKELGEFKLPPSSNEDDDQSPHDISAIVLPFYVHLKNTYGNTYLMWFGPTPRVVVTEPNLFREIFLTSSEFFEKYDIHPFIRKLEGDGLLNLKDEKWAHHRKILTPLFHMDNLKLLIPQIGRSIVEMLDKSMSTSTTKEVEIDVSKWFEGVTEEATTRVTFGRSYNEGKFVFGLQQQFMVLASEALHKMFIPGYRFLPTKKNRNIRKFDSEINKSLTSLIESRFKSEKKWKEEEECAKDLLGLLIDANGKPDSPLQNTVEDIMEECKTFFFAGKQTTLCLLTWAAVMLAMYPEWQEKAREEVVRVCGLRDIPGKEQLSKLKIVGMILNETLRLYPPIVALIRKAKENVDLGGYKLPKGTEICIPMVVAHHDKQLWGEDASHFNPARFSNGVAQACKNQAAYLPFGLGERMCIGQNLALTEAKLTIAILLQRVSLSLSPSYVHSPKILMLIYPEFGAPLIFRALH